MFKAFIAGLGRLIDFWPKAPVGGYSHENELEALRSDTQRIGDDMRGAICRSAFIAKPVQGPVNMADLHRKVMDRNTAARDALGGG